MKVSSVVAMALLGALDASALPRKCKSMKRRGKKCMMKTTAKPTRRPIASSVVPATRPTARPTAARPTARPTRPPTLPPTGPPTYASVNCPGVGTALSYGGHLYKLVHFNGTWDQANADAATHTCCDGGGVPGHLASITSSGENDFIRLNVVGGLVEDWLWMGFNDRTSEGDYLWTTGEAVNYTNWDTGEPNNQDDYYGSRQGEDCGIMKGRTGAWNDYRCFRDLGAYLIEFDCP